MNTSPNSNPHFYDIYAEGGYLSLYQGAKWIDSVLFTEKINMVVLSFNKEKKETYFYLNKKLEKTIYTPKLEYPLDQNKSFIELSFGNYFSYPYYHFEGYLWHLSIYTHS